MTSLLLVPLDDTVVFPTMDVTLPVDVGDEERVLLIPRHENEFAAVEELLELRGADQRVASFLRAIAEPGALADTIGYAPDVSSEDKVRVLETIDVTER